MGTPGEAAGADRATQAGYTRKTAAIATSTAADYRVEIRAGRHPLAADEPKSVGGADTAPSPIGLLLSALGSCTAITLRMYAGRKGWPLEGVRVHLAYEEGPGGAHRITRRIDLLGTLGEAQRARLLDIAERTPVTRAVREGTPVVAAGRPGGHGAAQTLTPKS
ncbi:OsmC family protein [Streptomyces hoynatensis]|uniref:OsmC family peroxiredoxin n=1 Tax=Streptomyces hoynatensis TaxID=1141874 RepID=A0A3A9Z577_9ACTN|nr:OsmC family protein [Streptomyces hoynatensis]RKN43014.1 OsmC family peroxiredoxin [Streptomyces hoynatensis]